MGQFKLVVFAGRIDHVVHTAKFDAPDDIKALDLQAEHWNATYAFGPWCDRMSSRLYRLAGNPRRWTLAASLGA